MCQFFSLVSDGKGNPYYFDAEHRKRIRAGKLKDKNGHAYDPDSHASIPVFFGLDEDKCNKYEFRPLDKKFIIDQINTKNDSEKIERFCKKLDFTGFIPELIIKPIVHPWKIRKRKKVTHTDLVLLKKWASVGGSMGASVGGTVRASVWTSVGTSVWTSVWDSVWDSVRGTVRDSVVDSVWAYISSFFNLPKWKYTEHKKGQNPFQSCIELWHRGLVPSFDGKMWRLHGPKGKILKEISQKELRSLAR